MNIKSRLNSTDDPPNIHTDTICYQRSTTYVMLRAIFVVPILRHLSHTLTSHYTTANLLILQKLLETHLKQNLADCFSWLSSGLKSLDYWPEGDRVKVPTPPSCLSCALNPLSFCLDVLYHAWSCDLTSDHSFLKSGVEKNKNKFSVL